MNQNIDIYLSTGHVFSGYSIGVPLISSGELVFTTGMVGYSEALTDPSYYGQILNFTYPLIGNYGVPQDSHANITNPTLGLESSKVSVSGVIVTENFENPKHRTPTQSLSAWLKTNNIPGICGLDTRLITQIIRDNGHAGKRVFGKIIPHSPIGSINRVSINFRETSATTSNFFDPSAFNLYPEVSNSEPTFIGQGSILLNLVNFGVKWNIVRELIKLDCKVRLLPWNCDYDDFCDADGWVFSNGPGDPAKVSEVIKKINKLTLSDHPLFGICLGHQLLALALGAKTERLPYGHRSHNQPVHMLGTNKGFITSQNHGFVVSRNSLPDDVDVWFENLNDGTIEGLKHKSKIIRSVQFHPEACGGPHDTSFLIKDFISDIRRRTA